jgi:uncharacterized protein YebE (UPF0316 family)
MKIFLIGFVQVFLVSINILFITAGQYAAAFISGFALSFLWTLNVKVAAFGTITHRIIYALGAALGCIVGMFFTNLI